MLLPGVKARETADSQLALAQAEYGHTAAAQAVVDAQYAVSASSSLTQDAVFGLAQSLERSGVSASQFKDTLKALADTSAVAGDQALKPLQKIIKQVEQTGSFKINDTALKGSGIKMAELYDQLAKNIGGSSEEIARKVKLGQVSAEDGIKAMNQVLEQKFAGGAAEKALGFDTQIAKTKENLTNLFKDVNTGPFLSALHQVLGLLDQNTAAGKAIHKVLTGAMSGFFSAAAKALPYVEAFLLQLGIAALDWYISIKKSIGPLEHMVGLDTAKPATGFAAVKAAASAVAFVIGSLVTAYVTMGIVAAGAINKIVIGAQKVPAVWHTVTNGVHNVYTTIKSALSKAVDYLKGLPGDFTAAGNAMIDGLIDAIKNGASKVATAVTDMAKGAVTAAKQALGIHSPSKAFYEIGQFNVAGLTDAHKDGAAKVQASIQHLVSIPANDNVRPRLRSDNNGAPPATPQGREAAPSISIAQGAIVINIYAREGQSVDDLIRAARREFHAELEEMATGTGGR